VWKNEKQKQDITEVVLLFFDSNKTHFGSSNELDKVVI